jgi:hypothetical protein
VVRARHFPHTKWANCRDRERHLRDLVNLRPISRVPPPNPSNTPWSGPCVRPQGAPGDGLAWGIDRPARAWLTWRHLGMSKDLGCRTHGPPPTGQMSWMCRKTGPRARRHTARASSGILPTGQFGYVENRPTRTRPPAKAIQANWRGPSAISQVRLPAPWEAVGNLIGSDRSQLHLRATRVRRQSPSSPTGERRGRRDPGPARPGRAPAPLQAPGAAGALDGEVLTNKSSQGRADAQRLVATRLLDRVHDPLGHFSRLQRIYPRAR